MSKPIFTKTLRLDTLTANTQAVKNLTDRQALQLVAPGQSFKVLITQEHYFNLLEKAERQQPAKTTPFNADSLTQAVAKKTRAIKKLLKPRKK